jgi:hypothetical protein
MVSTIRLAVFSEETDSIICQVRLSARTERTSSKGHSLARMGGIIPGVLSSA